MFRVYIIFINGKINAMQCNAMKNQVFSIIRVFFQGIECIFMLFDEYGICISDPFFLIR